uniref:Serpin domain-containing protein n=1 Tax=Bracon brevicornis TaxID=1563983 RepID=A0A6V7LXF4_9HYME
MNLFSTCGDENILSGRHHVEIYPTNSPRDIRTVAHQLNKIPFNNKDKMSDQSSTVKLTSTKINQDVDKPRLKLDRPFLYFVRHNPTGLILHMGRFNPRLLP